MSKVGIVTDTISCLPENLVKELNIKIVPTGLIIDGKHYRDTDLTNAEFWKLFNATKAPVTTTAVRPADFAAVFNEVAQSTDSIICITVSSKLSATHNAAVQAKELLKEEKPKLNIEVIDTATAAGAEGFLVIEAARAAQAGKSLADIVHLVKDLMPKVKFLTVMETLKYLIRSGRAPKTAKLGELMNVKPIIGMVSGTGLVESMGRARGKQKAMEKIVDMAKEHMDTSKPVHIMVHYTDGIGPADELKKLVTSRYKCQELYVTPYTPVMASQTGPVVAISFYSES